MQSEKVQETNAKREDEKLTKKYGDGSRKAAKMRLLAEKKRESANSSVPQQRASGQPPSA